MPEKRPSDINVTGSEVEEIFNSVKEPFGSQARHSATNLNGI
jgi:hypothetical protein